MTDRSAETREVYHKQHVRISGDERAMARFINMFSYEYFGLPDGWFRGKKVLDAGCGDTAKLLIALHRMGANDIHAFDLGSDFIPVAEANLRRYGVPSGAVTLRSGSVLSPPYEAETFDFVSCHGVLVHLNDLHEVDRAFDELARVTRPGGLLYTVYGIVGGLLEDAVYPAVREYYRTNEAFRALIDRLEPTHFHELVDVIATGVARHEGTAVDLSGLKNLLDVDLCVTIQNVIQAPVRLRIDESRILDMYKRNGFEQPRRLRRYVRRENIRKFFAPLHFERDHPAVQAIYGSGNLEFIARKAEK